RLDPRGAGGRRRHRHQSRRLHPHFDRHPRCAQHLRAAGDRGAYFQRAQARGIPPPFLCLAPRRRRHRRLRHPGLPAGDRPGRTAGGARQLSPAGARLRSSICRSPQVPVSMISAALVAALVGYGSTIALVLAAAAAVGADAGQTASWVAAICFSKAIGSALLSSWKKVPVVLAWSTPGAALIAASTGVDIHQAVDAFVFAGALIALTAAIRPLNRAVSAIPTGVASGMLA